MELMKPPTKVGIVECWCGPNLNVPNVVVRLPERISKNVLAFYFPKIYYIIESFITTDNSRYQVLIYT